jgi:hypothetical protein
MDTIIFPETEKTEYPDDYPQWLIDLLDGAERKGFYRGVNTVFWFFYRILNGGKNKNPSGER